MDFIESVMLKINPFYIMFVLSRLFHNEERSNINSQEGGGRVYVPKNKRRHDSSKTSRVCT